jgi:putative sigma-54 modulation protein
MLIMQPWDTRNPPNHHAGRPGYGHQNRRESRMVDIQISGVRYQVSDKVKTYVTDKLAPLSKYNTGLRTIHVTIHPTEQNRYRVDLDMHLPHGKDVIAHDSEETVYAAIDIAHDKAAAQLRKIHDKEAHRHRIAG